LPVITIDPAALAGILEEDNDEGNTASRFTFG